MIGADGAQSRVRQIVAREMIGREAVYDSVNNPGVSVLGAVLALCDSLGGVTGKELLLAVALGLDVSCRVALASTVDRGWHRTAAMGVFAPPGFSGAP